MIWEDEEDEEVAPRNGTGNRSVGIQWEAPILIFQAFVEINFAIQDTVQYWCIVYT